MNDTKHTPGPWKYRIADGIFSKGKRIAALSYAGKAISQSVAYDELEANAKLLASAPALVEALQDLASWARLFELGEASSADLNDSINDAQAALRNAGVPS